MALSVEDIERIRLSIADAFTNILATSPPHRREKILHFIYGFLMDEDLHMWATPSKQVALHTRIFTQDQGEVRDFVFALGLHFRVRWGADQEKFTELLDVISQASQLHGSGELSQLPQEYARRFGDETDPQAFFASNPWLVPLVVFRIFMPGDMVEKVNQEYLLLTRQSTEGA